MRPATLAATAIFLTLAGGLPRSASAGEAPAPGPCQGVASERFVLHSDPLVNLHHFLFQWSRATTSPAAGDRRRPVPVPEQDALGALPPRAREAWQGAVAFYAEHLVSRNLLLDPELVELKTRLIAAPCAEDGLAGLKLEDAALRSALAAAWPVYREHWWPSHDAANRAWIESQAALLGEHEDVLASRLAAAYGGTWPAEPVRVDVSRYANWAGAYTTNRPDHVTISSTAHTGVQGLELLFHEVSHAGVFEQPLLGAVAAAFRRRGTDPPDRLAHVIQFVTPAELLRTRLVEGGRTEGGFIADEMAQRRRNRERYRIVLAHWRPFLAGRLERDQALDRIVEELASGSR